MLSGDEEGPGEHTGIKAAASSRNIHEGTAGTDIAEHGFQMRIAAGRRCPLDIAQVGTSGHADAAVAPGLAGNPVQRVVTVLDFIVHGEPFAFAVFPAADILDHHGVAALYKTIVRGCANGFSIRGTN